MKVRLRKSLKYHNFFFNGISEYVFFRIFIVAISSTYSEPKNLERIAVSKVKILGTTTYLWFNLGDRFTPQHHHRNVVGVGSTTSHAGGGRSTWPHAAFDHPHETYQIYFNLSVISIPLNLIPIIIAYLIKKYINIISWNNIIYDQILKYNFSVEN